MPGLCNRPKQTPTPTPPRGGCRHTVEIHARKLAADDRMKSCLVRTFKVGPAFCLRWLSHECTGNGRPLPLSNGPSIFSRYPYISPSTRLRSALLSHAGPNCPRFRKLPCSFPLIYCRRFRPLVRLRYAASQ